MSLRGFTEKERVDIARRVLLYREVVRKAMRGFRLLDEDVLLRMAKVRGGLPAACAKLELYLRGKIPEARRARG